MLNEKILELIIEKVKKDYAEDVSLLVLYGEHSKNLDNGLGLDIYFVPKTDKAYNLSIQFIIDDVSFDLFPMRWDRLLKVAAMDSPQAYLILDSKIIYSSSEEDLQRFLNFKSQLKRIIDGEFGDALVNKAYEYLNETFIYLNNMEQYCVDITDIRIETSKILNHIANIVIFINKDYHKGGNGTHTSIISDSMTYEIKPANYSELVENIMFSHDLALIKQTVRTLVNNTRQLLQDTKEKNVQKEAYDTLFTGYYEELKGVLTCFRQAVARDDYYKLYSLAAFIQEELAQFLTKVEKGIWFDDRNVYSDYKTIYCDVIQTDLFESIMTKDNVAILAAVDQLEKNLIQHLDAQGIQFNIFKDLNAFKQTF